VTDKLEMPLEQFAEAAAKENARLNGHNEKLKEQTKLYFHAFNKATARIEELEAALDEAAFSQTLFDAVVDQRNKANTRIEKLEAALRYYADEEYNGYNANGGFARKALEGKDD
jgi:predicted  nucleic acid-binding Zn-ribbon protein